MIAPNETIGGKKTTGKARVKVEAPKIVTREEAEAVLHEIATIFNSKRKITADMDAEILVIKNWCQPELTLCDEQIAAASSRLAAYATEHPEIFPKDRKSVQWVMGKIGFRTDTPSLATVGRSITWAKVLGIILGKRLRKFIRTKIEVDKDAILARCGTKDKPTKFQTETLPALGLRLVQEEQFYVEPDLTKVEVQS